MLKFRFVVRSYARVRFSTTIGILALILTYLLVALVPRKDYLKCSLNAGFCADPTPPSITTDVVEKAVAALGNEDTAVTAAANSSGALFTLPPNPTTSNRSIGTEKDEKTTSFAIALMIDYTELFLTQLFWS